MAGFQAGAACLKDLNAAFLLLRTAQNTPSFLFGHHWSLVQTHGKEAADAAVRAQPTPAAFVLFRERQISIPSSICSVDEVLASRMLAAEITMKTEHFCCGICGEGFVQHDAQQGVSLISEVAITACKHIFHRSCAAKWIDEHKSGACPQCGQQGSVSAGAGAGGRRRTYGAHKRRH